MEIEVKEKAYDDITSHNQKSGKFRKTLIHMHTPASYDFKLSQKIGNHINYKKLTEDKIYEDYIINEFGTDQAELLKNQELINDFEVFKNHKEFYSYLLLGRKLIEEKVEIAVVSDHNSLDGLDKIKTSIEWILKDNEYIHCNIVPGIELSCADRMHVVVIFKEKQRQLVAEYLNENLISKVDGVMRTSYDVMKYFNTKEGCFAYIAHINSSDIFKDSNFLSGGYKRHLLTSEYSRYIGISDMDAVEKMHQRLANYNIKRRYILDCDSHGFDDFKNKFMWIKSANNTTQSFLDAFEEYDISILLEEPQVPLNYIMGIWISGGENSFLKGKNQNPFFTTFSPSLNSFIGGRGTGKSTTLDVIDFMLTQNFNNKEHLYFLSKLGTTIILAKYEGEEYLIESYLPEAESSESLLAIINEEDPDKYNPKIRVNPDKLKRQLIKSHLDIYKVIDGKFIKRTTGKAKFLNSLYDSKYSVNKLVSIAGSDEISDFLYEMLVKGKEKKIRKHKELNSPKDTVSYLKNVQKILEEDQEKKKSLLKPFNDKNENFFQITYQHVMEIGNDFLYNKFSVNYSSIINTYDITRKEIESYLFYLGRNISLFDLLTDVVNGNFTEFPSIAPFARQNRPPGENLKSINSENFREVIEIIFDRFFIENRTNFTDFFTEILRNIGRYSISFNINAFEFNNRKSEFKDISVLSLGQKVVAMLTVIFNHGDYSHETKPIIIDQPEDNLDNRYIYTNLVNQLKNLKEKRQVIIATHSSTIVTNSLVENVIVMESDGKNGWIKKSGYTLNLSIKKDIIHILEGGSLSFEHRKNIYNDTLSEGSK